MCPYGAVRSIAMTIAIALAYGCIAQKPFQTNFDIPTLALRDKNDIIKQGVQIGVAPITRDNEGGFPQLARSVTWREPDPGAPHVTGPEGRAQASGKTIERSAVIELAPLPAFFVGIANETGSALSLAQTKIEVEDNAHRPYSVILNAEALREGLFEDVTGLNPFVAGDHSMMTRLTQQISELAILSPSVTIPNGEVWKGYLVLDLNTRNTREYYSLMKSIQAFTVRLKGVPTASGPADFEFVLDKAVRPTVLNCPAGISDPYPERCPGTNAGAPASEQAKPTRQ
jgi:hypothetical protein